VSTSVVKSLSEASWKSQKLVSSTGVQVKLGVLSVVVEPSEGAVKVGAWMMSPA